MAGYEPRIQYIVQFKKMGVGGGGSADLIQELKVLDKKKTGAVGNDGKGRSGRRRRI